MVLQRCFEIKCASVSHVAHAEVQFLCQEWTENSGCDIKCIEEYTIASHTSVERHYLESARNELVQKCLCLEVRHKPQNVEQALRRVMQRNGLNMPEACLSIAIACGHDVRKAINTAQLLGQRSSSSELPSASVAERRHGRAGCA